MRRPAPILLLALTAQSCTWLDLPGPVLASVEPAAVPNALDVDLVVRGEHFHPLVTVDFDDPGRSRTDGTFDLALVHPDGRRFPLSGVAATSPTELRATLPGGFSPQTYDLSLVDPRGRTAVLPAALQIFQGDCSVNGAPCSSGNPCTVGDTCQGRHCQPGTPLPDGTPCQLACAAPVETCQAGTCTPPPGGCP